MLRGKPDPTRLAENPPPYGAKTQSGFPGVELAFSTEEHASGISFYQSKECFYLPYHLLQSMRFKEEKLTLVFATADVVITGRGLHQLYAQLAAQQVSRIVEQGDRYAAVSDALVHVSKIEEIPRSE